MKPTEPTAGSQRPLSLSDLNVNQLAARVSDLGAESYRVTQVLDGAWRSVATSWSEVTTLGKPLQERLANEIRFSAFDEVERQEAEDGATTKLLLTLSDRHWRSSDKEIGYRDPLICTADNLICNSWICGYPHSYRNRRLEDLPKVPGGNYV
jgi:hypothetical protein